MGHHAPFSHLLLTAIAAASAVSCSLDLLHEDPVHQSAVEALGPENPGVPPGPNHRPGQPCTLCHGPEGPAETQFTLAGTVFAGPATATGVGGAQVLLVDADYSSPPPGSVVTNCAGNFYLTSNLWDPAFPIRVAVVSGQAGAQMISHIGRAASCGQCHKKEQTLDSPGQVYILGAPNTGCAGQGGAR
jgi:hypothetical protein